MQILILSLHLKFWLQLLKLRMFVITLQKYIMYSVGWMSSGYRNFNLTSIFHFQFANQFIWIWTIKILWLWTLLRIKILRSPPERIRSPKKPKIQFSTTRNYQSFGHIITHHNKICVGSSKAELKRLKIHLIDHPQHELKKRNEIFVIS